MNKFFQIDELGSNWTREILAGFSLFLSISYIFVVNPSILAEAGIPTGASFFATVLISGIATLVMGLYARLPFALSTGFESNGFLTFVVVGSLGFAWQEGLGLIFWSGVLCLILTIIPVRQSIIDAIPEGLRTAIAASVGVFVAVVGFVVAGLVSFENGLPTGFGSLNSNGAALLALGFGISLVLSLPKLRFPAAMLVAIIICTVVANFLGVVASAPEAKAEDFFAAFGELDLFGVFTDPRAWSVLIVFFMIDFYGSIGKFIGLTRETNLKEIKQIKDPKQALYVDGAATMGASWMGTSTVITFVESAIAIGQGGRTGVVAVVCGILMLLCIPFVDLVNLVPTEAVSGVLVFVGWLLLPRKEIAALFKGEKSEGLDTFDLACVAILGLITAVTFGLDKALLAGFLLYTGREMIRNRGRANIYLLISTIALAVAMGLQYLVIPSAG